MLQTFRDMLRRLDEVVGITLPELAKPFGIEWNPNGPASNKSYAGDVIEATLGLPKGSDPQKDLGFAEVKTVPIWIKNGKVVLREHTKLTHFTFNEVAVEPWHLSRAYRKSRVVLFAPIVKQDLETPDSWYLRRPFIWMPTDKDDGLLSTDYAKAQAFLQAGNHEALTSASPPDGPFQVLIPNTGGSGKDDLTTFLHHGKEAKPKRRSWMLRKSFVEPIIAHNLAYHSK